MADDVVIRREAIAELLRSDEVARDLERRAIRVETAAKHLCPVDTGRLRSSITHQMNSDSAGLYVDIGTNVEYAIYQELGTRRMPAHPYLRPALNAGAGDG